MSYTLTLTDADGNTRTLGADEISGPDFARTHTGIGTWRVTVDYDTSLEGWVLSKAELEATDGDYLYRGVLETINSMEERGETELSGRGVGVDLERDARKVTYSSIDGADAIRDYWSRTPFSATVHDPSGGQAVTRTAQDAPAAETMASLFSPAATDPITVNNNDELVREQTAWFREAENPDGTGYQINPSRNDFSGGSGGEIIGDVTQVDYDINIDYEIPASEVEIGVRVAIDGLEHEGFRVLLNGDQFFQRPKDSLSGNDTPEWEREWFHSSSLSPGTHTITVEGTSNDYSGGVPIDCLALVDRRFPVTWDNSVDANQALAGPEPYAGGWTIAGATADESPWNILDGTLDVDMPNHANTQALQLRLSGGTWFPNDGTENNTETVTTDFGTESGSIIQGRATLGGYGTQASSPTQLVTPQKITSWTLTYDANNVPFIEDMTLEGDDLTNLQRLHEFCDMRFVIEHDPNQKTVTSWRVGEQTKAAPDWRILDRNRTLDATGYANHVTVRGAVDGGSRPTATVQDDAQVQTYGEVHFDRTDPSLTTVADVRAAALSILGDRTRQINLRGSLDVVPINIDPGYEYPIPWADGSTTDAPLEEVRYAESAGSMSGELPFVIGDDDLAPIISELKRDSSRTRDAI